jgi:glycosyltransferase involved in cell wall biosynthesis
VSRQNDSFHYTNGEQVASSKFRLIMLKNTLKKINVLFVMQCFDPKIGSTQGVINLAQYTSELNIYITGSIQAMHKPLITKSGLKLIPGESKEFSRFGLLGYVLNVIYWMVKLKNKNIELLHINYVSWGPSVACAAKILNIPIVARAGGAYSKKNYTCRWVDKYFAICNAQAKNLLNSPVKDKVIVVGNFMDRQRIIDSQQLAAPVAPKVEGRVRFLFVGQLDTRKGLHLLVEALTKVKSDVELLLVGGDWTKDGYPLEVKSLIQRNRLEYKVQLYDHREDVIGLLRQSDIFVLPTLSDTRPRVIMEAMCIGMPVISTSVGGIPELINSGENGLLISPNNVDELAAAMEKLAKSKELRDRLGNQAQAYADRYLDPFKTAKNYVAGYKQLIGF